MKRLSYGTKVLLMVMILALLGWIVILFMGSAGRISASNTAGGNTVKAQLQSLDVALLSYRAKAGFYRTTEQGLKALIKRPTTEPMPRSWSAVMLGLPKDPWGSDYIYEQPGEL